MNINIPEGITVLTGDFNGRIGDKASMVGGRLWLRNNIDKKLTNQGKDLMRNWNAAGMMPLSGLKWKEKGRWRELESDWTYTCKNGQSNIDHIGMKVEDLHRINKLTTTNEV